MTERVKPNSMGHHFAPVPLWILRRNKDEITEGAKALYGLLAYHAGKDGLCYPGQALLARELGTTDRTIRRRVAELRRLGLIEVEDRGPHRSSQYHFLGHEWMTERTPMTSQRDSQDQTDRPLESSKETIISTNIEEIQEENSKTLKHAPEVLNTQVPSAKYHILPSLLKYLSEEAKEDRQKYGTDDTYSPLLNVLHSSEPVSPSSFTLMMLYLEEFLSSAGYKYSGEQFYAMREQVLRSQDKWGTLYILLDRASVTA